MREHKRGALVPPAPLLRIFPRLLVETRPCVWVKSEAFGWVPRGRKVQLWPPGRFPARRIVVKSRPPGPKSWVGSRRILAEQVASPGSLGLSIGDP